MPDSGEAVAEHHGVENHGLEIRSVGHHVTLLLAYLLPLVILSKQIAVPIDYGIRVFHAPRDKLSSSDSTLSIRFCSS
ncbi:MAG TPA: hypothetical protein VE844_17075 [Gammaproteobacteria bacterium]|nr:hypothetical protein [Gammaproteobacteria bacterium]